MELTFQDIGIICGSIVTFLGFCFALLKFWRPIYFSYSRKYDKSAFGDKEDIIELTVKNHGLIPDTDIELTIASSITFELLNVQNGVTKHGNTIYISRIPPSSKVNILISSSSEHFTKESITSAKSASKQISYKAEREEILSYFTKMLEGIILLCLLVLTGCLGFIAGKNIGSSDNNYSVKDNIKLNCIFY